MKFSVTCKHCGAEVTAGTEDQLVERVQAHVRGHGATHPLPREAILRLAEKRSTTEDAA
jgi:hypothetical protein